MERGISEKILFAHVGAFCDEKFGHGDGAVGGRDVQRSPAVRILGFDEARIFPDQVFDSGQVVCLDRVEYPLGLWICEAKTDGKSRDET